MDKDLQGRIIATINGYVPNPIEDFVEDYKNNKNEIINLIHTLKHWANPQGDYQLLLSLEQRNTYFEYLQQILNHPKTLLNQDKTITAEDEVFILQLLQVKLNQIADELIKEFNLNQEFEQIKTSAVSAWWHSKTHGEQEEIRNQYKKLSDEQRELIKAEIDKRNLDRNRQGQGYFYVYYDPFPFYFMCNHSAYFHSLMLEATVRATLATVRLTGHVIHAGVKAIGSIGQGGGGGGNCGSSDDSGKAILAILAGICLFAVAILGAIGITYAAKKTYNSLVNLFEGKKVLRSIYRLVGIGVGGYYGIVQGAVLGAFLGSFIPGIGTAAGAIIGMICCVGIGAGVGALFAKYTAKGMSMLVYPNEINPTNPEKYQLTAQQIENLNKKNCNIDIVNKMIVALRAEKNKIDIEGSLPWSDKRKEKNELNIILKKLMNAEIIGPLRIGNKTYNPTLNYLGKPFVSSHAQLKNNLMVDAKPVVLSNDSVLNINEPTYSNLYHSLPVASAPLEENPYLSEQNKLAIRY